MVRRRVVVAANKTKATSKIVRGLLTVMSAIGAYTCVILLVISLFNGNFDISIWACGGIVLSVFTFIRSHTNQDDSDLD